MSGHFSRAGLVGAALLAALYPGLALAQVDTVGAMADHVVGAGTFTSIWDLLSGFAYLAGCFFGIRGALQLKENSDSHGQTKMSKPMMSLIVCALLLSLPEFFRMLQDTLQFANGASVFNQSSGSPAQGAGDIAGMAIALSKSLPGMMKIATYAAATAGAFFLLRALFMLPQVEQGRETMSKVVWMMVAGVGLWSLMPMISTSMATMGMGAGDPANILTAKYSQADGGGFDGTIAAVLAFVQFLGLIAFIRGMMILKAMGENKDGAMGRALTHILGGSAAMNITFTIKMLATTMGASGAVCGLSAVICS